MIKLDGMVKFFPSTTVGILGKSSGGRVLMTAFDFERLRIRLPESTSIFTTWLGLWAWDTKEDKICAGIATLPSPSPLTGTVTSTPISRLVALNVAVLPVSSMRMQDRVGRERCFPAARSVRATTSLNFWNPISNFIVIVYFFISSSQTSIIRGVEMWVSPNTFQPSRRILFLLK